MLLFLLALAQAPAAVAAPNPNESLPPLDAGNAVASPDHTRLAFETRDNGIWVLNLATKQVDLQVPETKYGIARIAWKPDGAALAVRHLNGQIVIHDSGSGAALSKLTAEAGPGFVSFAASGRLLVAAANRKRVDVFRVEDGERTAQLTTFPDRTLTAISVSPDGEHLALGDELGTVAAWKLSTAERAPQNANVGCGSGGRGVLCLGFSPDNKTLAIGGADCVAQLWTVGSSEPPRELWHCKAESERCDEYPNHDPWIGCVQFSPNGARLVSTTFGCWEARVWDVASAKEIAHINYGGGDFTPLSAWFSSDGKFLSTSLDLGNEISKCAGVSRAQGSIRWYSDGDIAWAMDARSFWVRKTRDLEPLIFVPIRDPLSEK